MKKRKKQKLISFVLILCMMLTMLNGMTMRANAIISNSVSNEIELKTAIRDASDGTRINITSDITITSEVEICDKSITIDGNNHVIKVPVTGLDESGIYNEDPSNFRVFNIGSKGKTVEINQLTVKGGAKEGILNNVGTTLKLTNVNISNSNNSRGGGGIVNQGGIVYIKDSNISRNAARYGGGFLNNSYFDYNDDWDEYDGIMFIENSIFSENRSTSSSGGGGAGENQGYIYANNSTFSNNKSTELGGAINNYGGTFYVVNSTFTGNLTYSYYSDYSGGAIANNGGKVTTLNSLFAYNYHNNGDQSTPNYSLNDVYAYGDDTDKIDSYYCIFQDPDFESFLSNNSLGNSLYSANADGSDNTIFANGINSKVLGADGKEIGDGTIFQPLLAKDGRVTNSALLKTASLVLGSGIRTSFENGSTPSIGYYDGTKWVSLVGNVDGSKEVTYDQNYASRITPTVGAVVTDASDIYLLKINATAGGTVVGGTIFGDAYAKGTSVNLTAIPNTGYAFSRWEYVDGGTGIASTSKSFIITVTENITLRPVFVLMADPIFEPDITDATNKDINVTIKYPENALVKKFSLDGSSYNDYTGAITFNSNGTLYAKYQDIDGNSSDVIQYNVNNIDKTIPIITNVTGNPSSWTSNDVTLTIFASDEGSGLSSTGSYSFDGGVTWQSENKKTFDANTNGIVVKVKDNAGNIATYSSIDITKIDKTQPNTSVIVNAINYTDSKWYNESQTITASFEATDGCEEKLQYKVDDSEWLDGESVEVNTEGKHDVSFRVKDALGRTGEVETVKVNIDKTAPTNAKITIEDKEFTTFLNKITFGLFFKNTVDVTISADDVSGISKIEYQKVSGESQYDLEGPWTKGSSLSVNPDEKFIIYAKITDNAGNYVLINSDGVIVDSTNPELTLTPDSNDWTSNNVNVKVIASDALAGLKEITYTTNESVPQTGTVTIVNGEGTIALINEGQYKLTVTAKDNSINEISESVNIKIDRTNPTITKITGNPDNWTNDDVLLTIFASDEGSGLSSTGAYSFDGGVTWQSVNTKTFDVNTNGIVVKVKDNAGNIATYSSIDITKIDNTSPNIPTIVNKEKYTDSKWYNENQTVTGSFEATDGCEEKLQYKVDDSEWIDGESVEVKNEGKHDVSFRVIDALGRSGEVETVKVNIDKTKPVITGAYNSSSYFIGRIIKLTDNVGEISKATYKNGESDEISFNDGTLFEKAGNYSLTVIDKAGNTATLSFEIKELLEVEDITYTEECKALIDNIRDEYRSHTDLPETYKTNIDNKIKALEARYSDLDEEIIKIKTETNIIKSEVDKLPNGIDGLISKEGKIREILSNIDNLSNDQQRVLKTESDLLNTLFNKINTLKDQVETVKERIKSLPSQNKITKKDFDNINNVYKLYSDLTKEQKNLLGEDLIKQFKNILETLKRIMLHDDDRDISVIDVDGTSLTHDVYLVVKPIDKDIDEVKFKTASKIIKDSSKYISNLKGKELLSLYDISIFKGNIKIQPDGSVKIKIKIPEEFMNRTAIDVVHIAGNGTVESMNAIVEGDYLVFTTNHFSDYGIVANSLGKEMPKTGSVLDLNSLMIIGIALSLIGIFVIKRKAKRA